MRSGLLEKWALGGVGRLRRLLEAKSQVTLALMEEGNLKYEKEFRGKSILAVAGNVRYRGEELVPYVGTRTLVVSAVGGVPSWMRDDEDEYSEYLVTVALYDRVFSEKYGREAVVKLPQVDLYMNKVVWDRTPVAVRCGCANFRFVWAKKLQEMGGLYGGRLQKYDPDKYLKKKAVKEFEKETGIKFYGGGRRPKEIEQDIRARFERLKAEREKKQRKSAVSPYPGACVHVWGLIETMINDGWVE